VQVSLHGGICEHECRRLAEQQANKAWFDVKLLTDAMGSNTTPMTSDSCRDQIKNILKALKLPSGNLLHLGCKLSSKILDVLEELEESKGRQRIMGQWSGGVWDSACSSKRPLGPVHKMAGCVDWKMCYNIHTTVEHPIDLLKQTPIGVMVLRGTRRCGRSLCVDGQQ